MYTFIWLKHSQTNSLKRESPWKINDWDKIMKGFLGECPNILFIFYQVSRQTQVIQMCMAELLYLIKYWSKHLMLRLNIQEFLLVSNISSYDWNNILRKYVGLLVVKCSPYLYWGYFVWTVKQILLQHLTYNQDNSTERINTKHPNM